MLRGCWRKTNRCWQLGRCKNLKGLGRWRNSIDVDGSLRVFVAPRPIGVGSMLER